MTVRRTIALAVAIGLAACAQTQQQAAQAPAPDIRLYTMDCGLVTATDATWFSDDGAYDGRRRELIVPCYLIRHPSGDLLWDAGLPQGLADTPDGASFGPLRFTVSRKLTDQLAQLGLTPADIEFLSVSHSHLDHIGNGGLFAASTWIVDADERAYAFRPEARADAQQFSAYSALENAPTRLIDGDGDHDVFGDGTVTIIQTPGHTPGHTALLVRLPQSGPVLLSGDLYHMPESRTLRRVPRFNTNRAQTLASMDKFERIAREIRARVIIEHVPADFASMPAFPDYLR